MKIPVSFAPKMQIYQNTKIGVLKFSPNYAPLNPSQILRFAVFSDQSQFSYSKPLKYNINLTCFRRIFFNKKKFNYALWRSKIIFHTFLSMFPAHVLVPETPRVQALEIFKEAPISHMFWPTSPKMARHFGDQKKRKIKKYILGPV